MAKSKINADTLAVQITADALHRLPPRSGQLGSKRLPLREKAQIAYEQQIQNAVSTTVPKQTHALTDFRPLAAGCCQAHTRDMNRAAQRTLKMFFVSNHVPNPAPAVVAAVQLHRWERYLAVQT